LNEYKIRTNRYTAIIGKGRLWILTNIIKKYPLRQKVLIVENKGTMTMMRLLFQKNLFIRFALVISICGYIKNVNSQENSVSVYIENQPEFSLFFSAIDKTGYKLKLRRLDTSKYTVFAPTNAAIEADEEFKAYLTDDTVWKVFLKKIVEIHIVPGQNPFPYATIFDGERDFLQTDGQQVNITQGFNQINGVQILDNAIAKGNGLVFAINEPLRTHFMNMDIYDTIEQQAELVPQFDNIIELSGFQDPITMFPVKTGLTFVVPRNRAIAGAEDLGAIDANRNYPEKIDEYLNPDTTDRTKSYLEYNLINRFIVEDNFKKGSEELLFPQNDIAHMWITKDKRGVFRFNDAELVRSYNAMNGVVYITDLALAPPGISEQLKYTGAYTSYETANMYAFLDACLWNQRNLTKSINATSIYGNPNETTFTIFAPLNSGMKSLDSGDIIRLGTLMWLEHTRDFIGYMMFQPAMTYTELYDMTANNNGMIDVEMVNHEGKMTFKIDEKNKLTIGDPDGSGHFIPIGDFKEGIRGQDGIMHVIDYMPKAPSVKNTIMDRLRNSNGLGNSNYDWLVTIMDVAGFRDLERLELTYFGVPNEFHTIDIPIADYEFIFQSMSFKSRQGFLYEGFLFIDELKRNYDGKTITSDNGLEWTVDVFNDTIYIDYMNPYCNVTVLEGRGVSDVLARTGVLQAVSGYFIKAPGYPKYTLAPTGPPVQKFGEGGGYDEDCVGTNCIGLPPSMKNQPVVLTPTSAEDTSAAATTKLMMVVMAAGLMSVIVAQNGV